MNSKFPRLFLVGAFVLSALPTFAAGPVTEMVPMADGVKLATDYYLPETGGPAFPVVFARSTYGRGMQSEAEKMNDLGFAFVIQDLRGMGGSEGEKHVFYTDSWREGPQDGKDSVAWIVSQPWCNGKVATFGPSALAITQMLMAPSTDQVVAQYMDMVPSSMYGNMVYQGGVLYKNMMEGWLTVIGQPHMVDVWKTHPTYDEYWQYGNAVPQAPKVTAAGLHVAGWFDIFQQGTLDGFVARQNNGGEGAKGQQILIVKPTPHGAFAPGMTYKVSDKWDDLKVSQYRMAFLEKHLLGKDSDLLKVPVHYFTMGDDSDPKAPGNEWRTAQTWPPFPTVETAYYLAADGALTTGAPKDAGTAGFDYDPNNPFPTHGGANLILPAGPLDQRDVNKDRTDWVNFVSEPLEEPIEATGRISVKLYVSTDAPDTDFTAKLVNVCPDGRELMLLDAIQRVKFRKGFEKPLPLLTSGGEVVEVTIDLWSTSWVFNKGHRIGVQISSSNYPRYEKNPNTGEDFPKDELRVAHNVIHFGGDHPSALVLPVRDPQSDDDEDGLSLREEFAAATNPDAADTDGDGVTDSDEIEAKTDPLAAPAQQE